MSVQNRSPAIKMWIKDVLDNDFVETEQQNGLKIGEILVVRANLIGVVISKVQEGRQGEIQAIEIEDSTGKICARTFDFAKNNADIGDCIFLIGRLRTYNNQKYIATEIIKKIDHPEWIELRRKELPLVEEKQTAPPIIEEKKGIEAETELQKILLLIKQKDTGQGVDYDEILQAINSSKAEQMLQTLIQTGEIFHLTPTKIKVLE